MRYLVQFGHSPHLARRELSNLLDIVGIKFSKQALDKHNFLIDTNKSIDEVDLLKKLGGTVRIATEFATATDVEYIISKIAKKLLKHESKIQFSVHSFDQRLSSDELNAKVKNALKDQDRSSRFITADTPGTSPLIIETQNLSEFYVLHDQTRNRWQIFETKAVTDVKEWQFRDRNRPAVDAFSGVMPPKVARMLVNLALKSTQTETMLDPFCGSGTILMEMLLLGYKADGSDISSQAVSDTTQNLQWLSQHYSLPEWHVNQEDVTKLTTDGHLYDAIVAEGYLGPSRFELPQLEGIITDLQGLYSQAIPQLRKVLKPTGRAVLALPWFETEKNQTFQEYLIDTCIKSGYTLSVRPIVYGHSKSRVKRAIFILDY